MRIEKQDQETVTFIPYSVTIFIDSSEESNMFHRLVTELWHLADRECSAAEFNFVHAIAQGCGIVK